MSVSVTYYGNQKAVFANQDDGIFSAVPITFDESVLSLETYTVDNHKYVKAGSVVKYGTTVKGITAEEYDITDGPVNGRVVLEGYVYVEALTEAATLAMGSLPKIVPIPYGKIIFALAGGSGTDVYVKVSGSSWATAVKAADLTLETSAGITAMVSAVEKVADKDNVLKVSFTLAEASTGGSKNGTVSIKSVASSAVVGASGKVISGLPIKIAIENLEVCNA